VGNQERCHAAAGHDPHDTLTWFEIGYGFATGFDFSGVFEPWNVRDGSLWSWIDAATLQAVRAVEARGTNGDTNLVRSRRPDRDLAKLKNFGAPGFSNSDCACVHRPHRTDKRSAERI
jgi:hypothetical protein